MASAPHSDLETHHYRTCPLCEAGCGLQVTVKRSAPDSAESPSVTRIRGDMLDVFSKGFLCPKGSTLKQLHEDPDRLRTPLVKRNGVHVEVSWDEAFAEAERLLHSVFHEHGRDAVGVYIGNPTAHNLAASMHIRTLIHALGTKSRFSASTVDQMPKHVSAGYLFGSPVAIPVPDLDRTDYLLMFGADPHESNGSLCTAPDFPGRIERIRERGGKVVVVDPRRSSTAQHADEWVGIRPGTDALMMLGMVRVLFEEDLTKHGSTPQVHELLNGLDDLRAAAMSFSLDEIATTSGVAVETIQRLARELVAAPTAAVYGRVGISMQRFGTISNWLVDVLNILSGNLDRPGGAMFTLPAVGNSLTHGSGPTGPGFRIGRGHSRVRGLPEVMGEYPVAAMAEEINEPGDGQLRAMVTIAGNPVLSTPNGAALDAALASLDCMISIDLYLNETTRHAHVIFPAPSALQKSHYDVLLSQFNVRNVANYSSPVLPLDDGHLDEWEILCRLAAVAQGAGSVVDTHAVNEMSVTALLTSTTRSSSSGVAGRDVEELRAMLDGKTGVERQLDVMLRTGPYGDQFGARPEGLSLDTLIAHPHGIDLGPLQPRLPHVVRNPSGKIELVPEPLAADLERLRTSLHPASDQGTSQGDDSLQLIGRRQLRSNNSWMHNINVLVKGKERCTLVMHSDDASVRNLQHGDMAQVTSSTNAVIARVEVSDDIVRGVVSLPHGWGHDAPGTRMTVAGGRPGVNSNLLAGTSIDDLDLPSGTSVLNGISVRVARVDAMAIAGW
jgi:anaerobic selenocysteine-containing dehydrogenase